MSLWRRALVIAVVAMLPASLLSADQPPAVNGALKEQVQRLLVQLDAPTLRERAGAERDLTALGPDVLPLLPPPELLPSVAVREAVRRVRVGLERANAIESVRPSRVTLAGEFPLAEILGEVTAQTGNPIEFGELPDALQAQRFSVQYEKLAFWPALDELIARAGLAYGDFDAERVVLVPQPSAGGAAAAQPKSAGGAAAAQSKSAVAYSGPFRIAVRGARLRPFPDSGPFRIVRVKYGATAEPRLRPLFVKYRGSDFMAKSPGGQTLRPFSPDAQPELPLGEGGRHLSLSSDFRVPADDIPETISFRGKLTLTAAAGSERIEFTGLSKAKGTARRRGGVTVTLQLIEFDKADDKADEPRLPGSNQARFRVVVSYDVGGPAFESHRTWIFHNRVYLEAKEGRIERDGVFHTELQTDGAVVVEYGFRNLPADLDEYRFVYVAPTLLVNLPIEFDFARVSVHGLSSRLKRGDER